MFRDDPSLRPILWIAAIDLSLALSVLAYAWVFDTSADFGGTLALQGVRIAAWMAHALWLLRPVQAWTRQQARGAAEDSQLLAADAAVQQFQRRFLLGYAGGWLAVQLVALVFDLGRSLSSTQVLTSQLSSLAVVLATPALMIPALDYVLSPNRAQLAADLLERGLAPERPRTPLARNLVLVFMSLSSAAIIGIGGVASSFSAEARQSQSVREQGQQAQLEALRVRVGESTPGVEVVTQVQLPEALALELAGGEPDTYLGTFDGVSETAVAAAPIGDGRWVVSRERLESQILLTLGLLLGGACLAMIPAVLASVALARAFTGPLAQLDDATRRVVETGALDRRARIAVASNDEVSDLARNFNSMLEMFEELARAATQVAGGDLRVELDRPGALPDAFRLMLVRLDEIVAQIRTTALEVATAASEIEASTEVQERAAERQDSSMYELNSTVVSLASSADSITKAAAEVLSDAERTRATTDSMALRMDELSRQAAGIAELLDQIREIADRSDLLALNGSLEAVRAGEAGRGFALVAGEMRRLAERVTGTVEAVGDQLDSIARATASTEAATHEGLELARNTARTAERISSETGLQNQGALALSEAVADVVEVAVEVLAATTQTRSTARGLRSQAESLERLTQQFKTRS